MEAEDAEGRATMPGMICAGHASAVLAILERRADGGALILRHARQLRRFTILVAGVLLAAGLACRQRSVTRRIDLPPADSSGTVADEQAGEWKEAEPEAPEMQHPDGDETDDGVVATPSQGSESSRS